MLQPIGQISSFNPKSALVLLMFTPGAAFAENIVCGIVLSCPSLLGLNRREQKARYLSGSQNVCHFRHQTSSFATSFLTLNDVRLWMVSVACV